MDQFWAISHTSKIAINGRERTIARDGTRREWKEGAFYPEDFFAALLCHSTAVGDGEVGDGEVGDGEVSDGEVGDGGEVSDGGAGGGEVAQ